MLRLLLPAIARGASGCLNSQASRLAGCLNVQTSLICARFKSTSNVAEFAFNGPIPFHTLTIAYARSSGPGGQNVNKVSTKADVRFHVDSADWLPDETKANLHQQQATKINKDGELVVTSTKTRSQKKNVDDAIRKILEMCKEASRIEREASPETKKRIKKLQAKAHAIKAEHKKRHAKKKADRRSVE
eukprot:TRINITY_DN10450_c0_g1_i1.p1 TRINITY_DN10450_c0_g1~~TRINITY_DN10450_c0_g1_i1.p1  ORF type:complete len:188 (+),score=22.06 TRINITY_DN10450_c0_g1_i1:24-587(+)